MLRCVPFRRKGIVSMMITVTIFVLYRSLVNKCPIFTQPSLHLPAVMGGCTFQEDNGTSEAAGADIWSQHSLDCRQICAGR